MEFGVESVKRRIASYREDVESWKIDHEFAMRCVDFEILLQHGLFVYDLINQIDEAIRAASRKGMIEFTRDIQDSVSALYRWWLEPCDAVLQLLVRFERQGYEVDHASEFRSAVREVRGVLTPDDEFFQESDVAALRDAAIESFERGECEPFTGD